MKNLTNAQLETIINSLKTDATNTAFTSEAREQAQVMLDRYMREDERRAIVAYYANGGSIEPVFECELARHMHLHR